MSFIFDTLKFRSVNFRVDQYSDGESQITHRLTYNFSPFTDTLGRVSYGKAITYEYFSD